MKILKWASNNILFIFTLFLLAFIPLYPKLPVIGIEHTWVYVRAEDFIVTFVILFWIILMLKQKITLKTPLTMPILIFWIIGAVSTIHGILLIFPTISNVFPNVAFLNYLRRIEYISLFFVAFSSIKDKKFISYVVAVLTITLLFVAGYGIGQKYLGFPAFLTMNEEFAKGIPIQLSALSRVSSTFGGHYDLAAYLVLIIPLLTSMVFGFRNWFAKIILLISISFGFVVLSMTVSRVSFLVLLFSLILVLILHKKKMAILAIVSLFIVTLLFLSFSTSLLQRFGNTVKEVDVLVDATGGDAVGQIKEIPSDTFKEKTIKIKFAQNKGEVDALFGITKEDKQQASNSALILLSSQLPPIVPIVIEPNRSNGESLPQGTGYVNLALAPITKKIGEFYYQSHTETGTVFAIRGNFLMKRVLAYDLSFTTRFQGEWPHAIKAFEKDVLFGSGYSSTGLAVDNNYLRILGEVGLLGFFSYFGILLIAGIYIKKLLPEVDSPVIKSFVFGFIAGFFGLALNAVLIDVFEASKIAFVLWLLVGITIGVLHLYQKKEMDLYGELKKVMTSPYTVIVSLFFTTVALFSSITSHYFVGDDFTWFRWIADCKVKCSIFNYFTNANGFFYRPGIKLYFLLMYSGFWLNQNAYHMVSIFLHFVVASLLFLIFRKILKNLLLATLGAFLFIILSGYSEAVFWISSTGFLFTALFVLLGLLLYIIWTEKKKHIYFILSLTSITFSLLFHELGIVAPLILISYGFVFKEELNFKGFLKKSEYAVLLLPILPYLMLRFMAQSHWFNGDYSYNLLKLPFNFIGNAIGYLMLDLFGIMSLSFFERLRNFSKGHTIFVVLAIIVIIFIGVLIYRIVIKKMAKEDRKIVIFGAMFFIISLLPFLGLGNLTSRYSYLSSVGAILLFVFFIKKTYSYLIFNGKNISLSSVIIIVSIFSFIHIIQLQKINDDWSNAGEKVKTFVISLDGLYGDYWKDSSLNFYFVNVPIRQGDAWVFPVGLKDAVWFVSGNPGIKVYQLSSLDEAFNMAKDPMADKVFLFGDDGSVIEKEKPNNSSVSPIIKK